jgi:hypothetical protein
MTYPYAVKFNGKWYRPNEDVPDTAKAVEESAIQPVISQVKEVQPEKVVEDEPKRRGRKRKE